MEICCPSCAVRYDVPVALATGSRPVRCVRCGAVWTPGPVAEGVELATPVPPFPPPPAAPSPVPASVASPMAVEPERTAASVPFDPLAVRAREPSAVPLAAAWTASLLVLLAVGAVLVVERHAVVRAWPPAARLYGVLGLRSPAARIAATAHPGPPAGQGGGGKGRG